MSDDPLPGDEPNIIAPEDIPPEDLARMQAEAAFSAPVVEVLDLGMDMIDGKAQAESYNQAIVILVRTPHDANTPESSFRLLTSENLSDTLALGILDLCKGALMNVFPDEGDLEEIDGSSPVS